MITIYLQLSCPIICWRESPTRQTQPANLSLNSRKCCIFKFILYRNYCTIKPCGLTVKMTHLPIQIGEIFKPVTPINSLQEVYECK